MKPCTREEGLQIFHVIIFAGPALVMYKTGLYTGLETLLKTRFNTLVISIRINENGVCIHTGALSIFVEVFHKNWKEHAKTEDKTYSGHPGHRGGKTDDPRPGTILVVRSLRPTKLQHFFKISRRQDIKCLSPSEYTFHGPQDPGLDVLRIQNM